MRSAYLVVEGMDGVGKTTQARLLHRYLEDTGHSTIYVREPGSTKLAEIVRSILLNPEFDHLTPKQNFLLFSLARQSLCEEVIKPSLKAGKVVVADRSYFSSSAYQGFGEKLGMSMIEMVNHWVMDGLVPDLSFIIDGDPKEVVPKARLKGKIERFEKEELDFHERVRKGYLEVARIYRSVIVPYQVGREDDMQRQIREKVDAFLTSQTP